MKAILSTLLLFGACAVQAQDSLNVKLLFHWQEDTLPTSSAIDNVYNEVWGYARDGREYAIIGSTIGTHIFDVTDPKNSHEVAMVPGAVQGNSLIHRDYHDYDDYLYIVADEGLSTLQIVDLMLLPDSAPIVYDSDSLVRTSHNIFIERETKRLYVCGGAVLSSIGPVVTANHLSVFSLANPILPELMVNCRFDLSFWNYVSAISGDYIHDIYVKNDTAYCHAGETGFFILDFSDTGNVQKIGSLDVYPQQGYNHSGWLSPNRKVYAMSDETWGMDIKIMDISDLGNIMILDTIGSEEHPLAMSHNLIFRDNFLYISHFVDGLYIYDLTNLDSIRLAGYYDTSTRLHEQGKWEGAWGVYPFLPSGNVLISDMQTGLWVFDVSDAITGIPSSISVSDQLCLYPNPTKGSLEVEGWKGSEMMVYDVYGKIVQTTTSSHLDLSSFSNGVYLIKGINKEGRPIARKVIKY
ncbi:MAG TPA: choice-of-anchor B family protein [Flavobacteriales bacterium]|nr:choice-of-anchor B family protein [Flavobacteriales bacterium]